MEETKRSTSFTTQGLRPLTICLLQCQRSRRRTSRPWTNPWLCWEISSQQKTRLLMIHLLSSLTHFYHFHPPIIIRHKSTFLFNISYEDSSLSSPPPHSCSLPEERSQSSRSTHAYHDLLQILRISNWRPFCHHLRWIHSDHVQNPKKRNYNQIRIKTYCPHAWTCR